MDRTGRGKENLRASVWTQFSLSPVETIYTILCINVYTLPICIHIQCIYYTCIGVYMCIYTHVHTTEPNAHYKSRCYTNSSRGNKVGLLQQITKNKNSSLQWLVISVCSHGMDCNKEKRNSVSERGKTGETISIQGECSNVLYHFISHFC